MLAYTTVSDIVVAPTAVEAAVYLGGLMLVLVCPYLFLNLVDKFGQAKKNIKASSQHNPNVQ